MANFGEKTNKHILTGSRQHRVGRHVQILNTSQPLQQSSAVDDFRCFGLRGYVFPGRWIVAGVRMVGVGVAVAVVLVLSVLELVLVLVLVTVTYV
eukprot:scaffold15258_cov49-Attheya_sp.AAC.6